MEISLLFENSKWYPTHKIFYTEEDSKFVKENKQINISGSGYIEVDKRTDEIVDFYFQDLEKYDEDELSKFFDLIKPLYYKKFNI